MPNNKITSFEELRALRAKKDAGVGAATGGGERRYDPRPIIRLITGDEVRAMREAEDAMIKRPAGVYQHAGKLVKIARVIVAGADKSKTWSLRFVPITVHAIIREFTEAAQFEKWDQRADDYVAKPCPKLLAEMYFASPDSWAVPTINGIVTAPTLRPDGSIIEIPGYDERTGLLYDPLGVRFLDVPEHPGYEEAAHALGTLKRLFRSIAFTGGGTPASWDRPQGLEEPSPHRSVALSAVLSAVARPALPTVPFHGFSSHDAGAGKSKLADTVSVIALGHRVAVTSMGDGPHGDAELEKKIASDLLAGEQIVSLDNADRPIGGGFLCQVASQERLRLRVLGKSETHSVANTLMVLFTGVNATVQGDLIRRSIMATIDPGHERAELDQFRYDPVTLAMRARPLLIRACLTVIRAWLQSEHRPTCGTVGSFEGWSRLIRDALVWLGEPDPMLVVEGIRGADPKLVQLRGFMHAWETEFGSERVTIRELVDRASTTVADAEGNKHWAKRSLRDALLDVTSGKDAFSLDSRRIAWFVRKNLGRFVDGRRFVMAEVVKDSARWVLDGAKVKEEEEPF